MGNAMPDLRILEDPWWWYRPVIQDARLAEDQAALRRMRAEWYDVPEPDVWEGPSFGHRLLFMAVLTFGVTFWLAVTVAVAWWVEGRI